MGDIPSLEALPKRVGRVGDKYGIVYAIVFGSAADGRCISARKYFSFFPLSSLLPVVEPVIPLIQKVVNPCVSVE